MCPFHLTLRAITTSKVFFIVPDIHSYDELLWNISHKLHCSPMFSLQVSKWNAWWLEWGTEWMMSGYESGYSGDKCYFLDIIDKGFLWQSIWALTDPTDDLSPTTRNAKLNKHEGLDWALATLSTSERARRLGSARACSAGFVKFDSLVVPNKDRSGSFTVRFTVIHCRVWLVLLSIFPPWVSLSFSPLSCARLVS